MKYIILTDGNSEFPVLFDQRLVHRDVARGIRGASTGNKVFEEFLRPVSAGFVYFNYGVGEDGRPKCNGESESLKVSSRGPVDARIIEMGS